MSNAGNKEDTAILHHSNTHLLAQPLPFSILGTRFVQLKMSQPRHPPPPPTLLQQKTVHDNGVKGSEGVYSPIYSRTLSSHISLLCHISFLIFCYFSSFFLYTLYITSTHTHTHIHKSLSIQFSRHRRHGSIFPGKGKKEELFSRAKISQEQLHNISAGLGWGKMNIRSDTRRDIKRRRRERESKYAWID